MSQHPSLKSVSGLEKKRNVLKRYERIARILKEKGEEGLKSIFGLPKYKRPRLKVAPKIETEAPASEGEEKAKENEKGNP